MPPSRRPSRSPGRTRAAAAKGSATTSGASSTETVDADAGDGNTLSSAVLRIVEESMSLTQPNGQRRNAERDGRFGQKFLTEVRRRMRADREALHSLLRQPQERLQEARAASRRRATERLQRVEQIKGQVVRRVRKRILGAEDRRLRDFGRERLAAVRQRLEKPPVIRLRDKFSFLLGVIGCGVIEAVALTAPEHFWACYVVCIVPLLVMRVYIYRSIRWQYYLLDFCYAENLSCLVQLFFFPTSSELLVVNFLHATGPLAMAIPTWRNSLVFHSLDKVTSAFIHMLPALLTFLLRWHPLPGLTPPEELVVGEALRQSLAFYALWQLCYLLIYELLFRPARGDSSSIRELTRVKPNPVPPRCYTGITRGAWLLMSRLGVMKPGELFDAEHWKTKLIFIAVQFVYTVVMVVPACYLWNSARAHLAYLGGIIVVCVWNGGSYYIEVFSRAYAKQFEGDAAQQRQFQTDLLMGNLADLSGSDTSAARAEEPSMGDGAAEERDDTMEGEAMADDDVDDYDEDSHVKFD